ncbi:MAG: phytanoyl-CoA dioxygenase family protein [Acidimicrobiales bacterium]|nr:phytanoyl-CoA dioxygenase family protein [Acidimicrobiales bacterium]
MTVEHLPADAATDEIVSVLRRDGCVVLDNLVTPEVMDRFRAEMQPYIDGTAPGGDTFSGRRTKRTGGLIARSATARELVMHPTVTGVVGSFLGHATNHHLHLTQTIAIGPDEPFQPIHRDQWAFDFFPFPADYDVQCNTMWAVTDFTETNGATRVIVGSTAEPDGLTFDLDQSEPAEMTKGSVLLYTGKLYHGGGPNRSDHVRVGGNITYAVAWLRQEENQYLSVPADIARELDDDLLRVMGYAPGAYALGYVDDLRDPLDVLKGTDTSRGSFGVTAEIEAKIEEQLAARDAEG